MKTRYSKAQLVRIVGQAAMYQCACPAQVSDTIRRLRELHAYQQQCLDSSDIDREVHTTIARAAEQAIEIIEQCLADVLRIEGWDPVSLEMPDSLKKRLLDQIGRDERGT
jgi:hypothetical protein